MKVQSERVYGSYAASYPFGTETLVLNRDGTFVQQVTIKNEPPAAARGSWKFDPANSRVDLYGSMIVVDGFGKLRNDWRNVKPGVVSMDVEMHWSKILMGSAGKYPYVKQ